MIKCRVATPEDAPRIKELLCNKGDEWLRDLDWSNPETWMVAENGKVEALIQLCPGKPIAHLEHLIINEALSHIEKGKIFKVIMLTCTAALRQTGAELITGSIPFELKAYKEVLQKRGGWVVTSGHMIALRLK